MPMFLISIEAMGTNLRRELYQSVLRSEMEASSGAEQLAHDFLDRIFVGLSQIRRAGRGNGTLNASFPNNSAVSGPDHFEINEDSNELP
jgi:hypothetical protein